MIIRNGGFVNYRRCRERRDEHRVLVHIEEVPDNDNILRHDAAGDLNYADIAVGGSMCISGCKVHTEGQRHQAPAGSRRIECTGGGGCNSQPCRIRGDHLRVVRHWRGSAAVVNIRCAAQLHRVGRDALYVESRLRHADLRRRIQWWITQDSLFVEGHFQLDLVELRGTVTVLELDGVAAGVQPADRDTVNVILVLNRPGWCGGILMVGHYHWGGIAIDAYGA